MRIYAGRLHYEVDYNSATPADAQAVLAAYDKAKAAGQRPVDCYHAATAVWSKRYPDHTRQYAGAIVVELVTQHRLKIKSYIDAMIK